jgi:AhpD family alkylhydroperoxidase
MPHPARRYSVSEYYAAIYRALRTSGYLLKARGRAGLDSIFRERIMLAVTEVNGCAICSYVHTRMALEIGMNSDEIREILAGALDGVPADQAAAVAFGQHYADTKGKPERAAWERIAAIYGPPLARGILGAVCVMTFANLLGIAWTSLFGNRKGGGARDSRGHALLILLSGIPLLPIALIHALAGAILRQPVLRFASH